MPPHAPALRGAGKPAVPLSALVFPSIDPTPIFEQFRGNYAHELLTAAVAHFGLFDLLARGPMPVDQVRHELRLAERPSVVLFTALRAMGLLALDAAGCLELTPLAREHLTPGSTFDVSDYLGLAAESPGVLEMATRLRLNRPSDAPRAALNAAAGEPDPAAGTAFIFRAGTESAMEHETSARRLTLALAGRAKNVAPLLAARMPLGDAHVLLDVGGGTGIYSIACLQQNPGLRAIVWDRPEVLKVTAEFAAAYGVADRLECQPGDMFRDPVPEGVDVILMSNILHDWDVPECRTLLARCAAALPPTGQLLIHDVFLNDAHDGPLPVALYSAALFLLTEGRAYSAAEYCAWLTAAGLTPSSLIPTIIHCAILPAHPSRS